jgi:two-component system, cell cycle sensor histidine kinase and response regulator CckA
VGTGLIRRLRQRGASLTESRWAGISDAEALLEGLFEHSPVAFQICRADGRGVVVNQAFRELFGSEPPSEYDVLEDAALDRQGFLALVRRAFAGETTRVPAHWYEPRELRPLDVRQGRRVGVEVVLFPLRGREGEIEHVALCFKDATAELERRAERQELEATLDSVGDGLITTDARGNVTRMNPVAERLTGFRSAEANGRPLSDVFCIVSEESREPADSPVARVLREGVVVGLATRTTLIARDGSELPIADSAAPIRDVAGETHGVVLVFRDQRAERETEGRLRQSEARKAAVLDAALDSIVSIDEHGRIIEVNTAFERTFGYDRSEAVGRSLAELIVPPELQARHVAGLARYLATGEARILGKRVELTASRRDGSEIPVEVAVVRSGTEGPPMFTGYLRDLSERKRLSEAARRELSERERAEKELRSKEDQLRQAQRLEGIGQLAGGVAHDFNNILTVILGHARTLLDEDHPPAAVREGLDDIVRAGERAADLTRQLLAFSRRQVLQPKLLDLNDSLDAMTRMLGRLIGEDIELTLKKGRELGLVLLDPGQLEQVVLNLAVNARDAMPRGGSLTLETLNVDVDEAFARRHIDVVPGPHVMLSVSDNGVGMDEETQDHVFEPFFTTKERGTGLGLATVFGIVKQSGGAIWVYSERDRGTTFKIYFPRQNATERSVAVKSVAPMRTGSETILLVEDAPDVRKLATRILTGGGYRVLSAAGGDEAERVAREHVGELHLLLTDVVMPGMSGRELAERLSGKTPLRVLYMSGYTDDAVVRHGVLEEGVKFIQKPFTPRGLLAKVREVLDAE